MNTSDTSHVTTEEDRQLIVSLWLRECRLSDSYPSELTNIILLFSMVIITVKHILFFSLKQKSITVHHTRHDTHSSRIQIHFGFLFTPSSITLSGINNTRITKSKWGRSTSYGRVIAKRGEKHNWKIRINQTQNGWITIGVSYQNDPQRNTEKYNFTTDQMGFGYYLCDGEKCTNGKWEPYTSKKNYVSGDVIDVCVDLRSENGTLSFNDFGIAFDDLNINEEYRLAVYIETEGDSVTILSHDTKK